MEKNEGHDGTGGVTKSASEWANVIRPSTERRNHERDPSDKVPQAMEGTLAAVAASIIYSVGGMSRWGLAEATLGLYKVYCRHDREVVIDTINGSLVTSALELQEISHWLKWAYAAYENQTKSCARLAEIKEDCVVKIVTDSSVGKPAYFIGMNHAKRAVVLSVRGTFSATDVLTDLKPHSEAFEDGYAHSGMLNSARWLRDNVAAELKDLMTSNGYRLVLTGHSLGAGTASLLCMLLRETNSRGLTILGSKPEVITCWSFCCPPCVDRKLAEEVTFIRNVVHQDDIVARISPAALEDLRTEILQTDWTHALEDGTTQKKLVDVAQASKSFFDGIEPALNYEKGELVTQLKQQGLAAMKGLTDSMRNWAIAKDGTVGSGAKLAIEKDGTIGSGVNLAVREDSALGSGVEQAITKDGTDGSGVEQAITKDGTVGSGVEQTITKDGTGGSGDKQTVAKVIKVGSGDKQALAKDSTAGSGDIQGVSKDGTVGSGAKQKYSWITTLALAAGGELANAAKQAITKEMDRIESNNKSGALATASSMAANAHATNLKEGTEFLETMRLFVPGVLYHVIRRPLNPGEVLPTERPLGVGTSKGVQKEENDKYKHIVVRGDDPSSRFQRIVLSSSLISDHLLANLQIALADAMKWQQSAQRI